MVAGKGKKHLKQSGEEANRSELRSRESDRI